MFTRLFLNGICAVAGTVAHCRAPAVESGAEMNETQLTFQSGEGSAAFVFLLLKQVVYNDSLPKDAWLIEQL